MIINKMQKCRISVFRSCELLKHTQTSLTWLTRTPELALEVRLTFTHREIWPTCLGKYPLVSRASAPYWPVCVCDIWGTTRSDQRCWDLMFFTHTQARHTRPQVLRHRLQTTHTLHYSFMFLLWVAVKVRVHLLFT